MPQPPFDRTISEGSGDGAGLKVEGNSFSRPFGLDFLQDVISVQWNSGLFFATDPGGRPGLLSIQKVPQIFHSKGGKEWKGPAAVSVSDFEDGTGGTPASNPAIFGAVGGKIHDGEQGKVFVVCGVYGYRPPESPLHIGDHTVLSFSYDGITWEPISLPYSYIDTDKFLNDDIDTEVDNVIFIPETKTFYADVSYANGVWSRDMFSSVDGVEWSIHSSNKFNADETFEDPPFLCDFVKFAISAQDDNGLTGVTNSQTGTVLKFSNIRAVPDIFGGFVGFDNPVLRNEKPIDIPGLTIDGLCYAGGVFIVSGHFSGTNGAIYRSADDGITWKKVKDVDTSNSNGNAILCGGA